MTEVVQPLLPQRYNDERAFLDYVETDPSLGLYVPPQGNVVRLRWLSGFYQHDGTGQPLIISLNMLPTADAAGAVIIPAIRSGAVGGLLRVVFSTEIGTPTVLPDSSTLFIAVSLNPLPLVTVDATGLISVGYNNGTRLEPDQMSLEMFPQEGNIPAESANADLYLLPALG